ncbi:MAG: ParA family protein [Acidobacteriota bacterium]
MMSTRKNTCIAVANQKGGCGKTTTAVNLSACLADKGERVLMMDLDPQSHATVGLAGPTAAEGPGLAEILGGWARAEETIQQVGDGLDVVASSWRLADIESRLIRQDTGPTFLAELLDGLPRPYDRIILDCPPSTGLITRAALAAAGLVLVPVETSYFALYGVGRMLSLVEEEEQRRRGTVPCRVLLTMFDRRTRLAREVLRQAREHFGPRLLNVVIAGNVSLREAAARGCPITSYRRRSRGFRDHMELREEVIATLSAAKPEPHARDSAAAGGSPWKI